jgi:hypothetical protein
MHSFHWVHPSPDKQFNDPTDVTIQHNGDYSGQAKVHVCFCPPNEECLLVSGSRDPKCFEVEIPCWALIAFAGNTARSEIISAIEMVDLDHGIVNHGPVTDRT